MKTNQFYGWRIQISKKYFISPCEKSLCTQPANILTAESRKEQAENAEVKGTFSYSTLVTTIIILFSIGLLQAQQLPHFSQYMQNDFVLNPAVAGSYDYSPVLLTFRSQWTGFNDAPVTQTVSAHTSLLKNMGLGGFLFNDKTGPISRMGLQLAYAYHVRAGAKSYLSFGVGAMMYQHVLDKSLITLDEPDDNAMLGDKTRKLMADAVFGIKYTYEGFYFGFSAPQLIQSELKLSNSNLNKLVRHYFVNTGYKININDDVALEPSILFKAISAAPMQLDGNLKVIYKDMLWLGSSFRNGDAAVIMVGLRKNSFQFGYSYDATLSEIKKYSSGTHEIVLGLVITSTDQMLRKMNSSKAKY